MYVPFNENGDCETTKAVPDLDKEGPNDWRKMEVCLFNFNKGEDDEGCLKFCNILKWSATV